MIWIFPFVFTLYCLLIIYLSIGFILQNDFKKVITEKRTCFSIIIPFRNEADNLPRLLDSIRKLNYSSNLFEIIFIDDDSTDNSFQIIQGFKKKYSNVHLIKNERKTNSPKKDAITKAIQLAYFDWILTTDADCTLPEDWLMIFNSFIIENNSNMVIAPVTYKAKDNFLDQFQLFDFMSLQGATIGGFGNNIPFLCNGANLCYKKEVFQFVNGFEGNSDIASGDDIFLFEKFLQLDKKKVKYLKNKEVIVTTFPVESWKKLLLQRIRWASKTSKVTLTRTKLIGVIIFLGNLSIILNAIYATTLQEKIVPFIIKFGIDLLLILPTLHFFNQKQKWWKYYFLCGFYYPIFSVRVAIASLFSNYSWKGRNFKK